MSEDTPLLFQGDAFGFRRHLLTPGGGKPLTHGQFTLGAGLVMLGGVDACEGASRSDHVGDLRRTVWWPRLHLPRWRSRQWRVGTDDPWTVNTPVESAKT